MVARYEYETYYRSSHPDYGQAVRRAEEALARATAITDEYDRKRRERALTLGDRVPPWVEMASVQSGRRCSQAIDLLIDGRGTGACTRRHGHDGRHMSVPTSSLRIIAIGPWRERINGEWMYFTPRGTTRFGSETKPRVGEQIKRAAEEAKKEVKAAKKAVAVPVKAAVKKATGLDVVVGKPCPKGITLDQGAGRCDFYGEKLDHLVCSRKKGHKGSHIATDGDQAGAEVLALFTPK